MNTGYWILNNEPANSPLERVAPPCAVREGTGCVKMRIAPVNLVIRQKKIKKALKIFFRRVIFIYQRFFKGQKK